MSLRAAVARLFALGSGCGNALLRFWRFVMVQKTVGKLAETAVEFPPMQASASFNLSAVKARVEEMLKRMKESEAHEFRGQ
jgi:hypothetical protein